MAAASRRSRGRVSVPLWLIILSDQLPVFGLVSRYLTNYLMGRRLISRWRIAAPLNLTVVIRYYLGFPRAIPVLKVNSYVLLTRPPLAGICIATDPLPFDLRA